MNDSLKQMLAVFTKNNFEELINCKNNKQQVSLFREFILYKLNTLYNIVSVT